jgi:tRNA (cmo5U34)-methyltransferase
MPAFDDPASVARYAEGPARQVPGFADLQRMAAILVAERMGADGEVLVLGAGGGLELRAFAEWQPGWRFTGVDPSAPMLALAQERMADLADRVLLHQGVIHTAPQGLFDGATCLLTLHFVPKDQRLPTLIALRQRLKPGAPLVLAHHSFPQDAAPLWLNRYAAFAVSKGVDPDHAARAPAAISAQLTILDPGEEEALLAEAGFTDVALFYAAFTFRGWVAVNPC